MSTFLSFIQMIARFLDASTHLFMRVCPSVRPSVHPSVRPSVRHVLTKSVKTCRMQVNSSKLKQIQTNSSRFKKIHDFLLGDGLVF